jgi:hypothetical protein
METPDSDTGVENGHTTASLDMICRQFHCRIERKILSSRYKNNIGFLIIEK